MGWVSSGLPGRALLRLNFAAIPIVELLAGKLSMESLLSLKAQYEWQYSSLLPGLVTLEVHHMASLKAGRSLQVRQLEP